MASVIECVSEHTYQKQSKGHLMTLRYVGSPYGKWEMLTTNAMTQAHLIAMPKYFDSLKDVEASYKSWTGISLLVNEPC